MAQLFGGVVNEPRSGTVLQVQENTMVRVSGLRQGRLYNLVEFETGGTGVIFHLEQNSVAVALLDDGPPALGSDCNLSPEILGIPVGDGMVGRVVDPLGRPLQGIDPVLTTTHTTTTTNSNKATKNAGTAIGASTDDKGGAIKSAARQPSLTGTSPGIMARKPLCCRLATGIKALDAFHPIGHGQCIALLGRRGGGKSSLCTHIMVNQRGGAEERVHCIYVAVGQEEQSIKRTVATLMKEGCMEYVTIIAAPATSTAGMRFLAPYAGVALGEYWRDQGGRSLVIIDDISSHSTSHHELARFIPKLDPEAGLGVYGPLFERFAQLSDSRGGGSMTGLVVVEGEAAAGEGGGGDEGSSDALAHKVNSIADHSILLNVDLARKKVFPAVDVTYQMNMQNPGSALLPEPMKAFIQNLRAVLAELIDEEAGAQTAEELGIRVEDEEADKAERLVYLTKIREIFRQKWGERVDDQALLLYLLCTLKGFLQDLDLKALRQLDHVITTQLPKAKGWKKLSKDLARILHTPPPPQPPPPSSSSSTSSSHPEASSSSSPPSLPPPSLDETVAIYQRVYDVLWNAVEYSRMKSIATTTSSSSGAARKKTTTL